MEYTILKDIGGRREQQDSVGIFEFNRELFMVLADGMGGHDGGAIASQKLLEVAESNFLFNNKQVSSPNDFFESIIQQTQEELTLEYKNEPLDPNTTLTLVLIIDRTIYYCYMGDSRLYLFEREKKLIFRTRDDSVPEMLFQTNQITEEEIATHPQQNVLTKSLGIGSRDVASFGEIKLSRYKEYRVLLGSDGLWATLKEDEMYNELFSSKYSLELSTKKLLGIAKYRGGDTGDNISIATLAIPKKKYRVDLVIYIALLVVLLIVSALYFMSSDTFSNENNSSLKQSEKNSSKDEKVIKKESDLEWSVG